MIKNPEGEVKMNEDSEDNLAAGFRKFVDEEVTDDVLEKARQDLGETPAIAAEGIRRLRQMIQEKRGSFLVPTEDHEIIKFLRVAKFDVPKAFSRIKNFYNQRKKYTGIFANYYPSSCEKVLRKNIHHILPYRNSDGSPIYVSIRGHFDPTEFSVEDYLRLNLLGVEACAISPINQICGFTFILDCDALGYNHLRYCTPGRVWMMSNILQNAMPVRFNAIHVVNIPSAFSLFYNLIYPLLSDKFRKRLIIHPRDPDFRSLHNFIPPTILPANYGGKLAPMNSDLFKTKLYSEENYFKNLVKYWM